jgi:hypothetical protein
VRVALIVGWLAGAVMILAGLPWPAGCLGPAAGAASVLAWRRWGGNLRTLLQLAGELVKLRKHVRKIVKTGSAVERA